MYGQKLGINALRVVLWPVVAYITKPSKESLNKYLYRGPLSVIMKKFNETILGSSYHQDLFYSFYRQNPSVLSAQRYFVGAFGIWLNFEDFKTSLAGMIFMLYTALLLSFVLLRHDANRLSYNFLYKYFDLFLVSILFYLYIVPQLETLLNNNELFQTFAVTNSIAIVFVIKVYHTLRLKYLGYDVLLFKWLYSFSFSSMFFMVNYIVNYQAQYSLSPYTVNAGNQHYSSVLKNSNAFTFMWNNYDIDIRQMSFMIIIVLTVIGDWIGLLACGLGYLLCDANIILIQSISST